MQGNLFFKKKKKAEVEKEWLNILPKSLHAKKKPPHHFSLAFELYMASVISPPAVAPVYMFAQETPLTPLPPKKITFLCARDLTETVVIKELRIWAGLFLLQTNFRVQISFRKQ